MTWWLTVCSSKTHQIYLMQHRSAEEGKRVSWDDGLLSTVQSAWVRGEKADRTRILSWPKLLCLRNATLLRAFRSNNRCMHELTVDHAWLNFNITLKYRECLYWPGGRNTAGKLWNQNTFLQYIEWIRGLCPLIKKSCRVFEDLWGVVVPSC